LGRIRIYFTEVKPNSYGSKGLAHKKMGIPHKKVGIPHKNFFYSFSLTFFSYEQNWGNGTQKQKIIGTVEISCKHTKKHTKTFYDEYEYYIKRKTFFLNNTTLVSIL